MPRTRPRDRSCLTEMIPGPPHNITPNGPSRKIRKKEKRKRKKKSEEKRKKEKRRRNEKEKKEEREKF